MTSFHLALLRGAAWMVPGAERAEWLAEWRAELWYVDRGATRFCLGAFRDALWLRRNRNAPNSLRAFGLESPVRCVLALAALAAAVAARTFRLPGARSRRLAVITGAAAAAGTILFFLATHQGFLAVTAVLTSLYPAVTIVLARVMLGERLTVLRLAGLGLAGVCVSLIAVGGAG